MLLLLTWAVLWLVPTFRSQNRRALRGPMYNPVSLDSQENELASVIQANPQDPFAQSLQLELNWQNKSSTQDNERFFRGYDALIARYPTNTFLRRDRLRRSTTGNIVAMKYTLNHYKFASHPCWLNADELRQVVMQARAAQKVDRDDAFFPWIEAMALWGLGQENDSIKALERAGHCPKFNDGSVEWGRRNVELFNRRYELEWDDRLITLWRVLLPHYAGMRALTREVCYSGAVQFQKGNRAEAWRRWEVALRANRVWRLSSSQGRNSLIISILAGEGSEQVAWDIAAQSAGHYRFQEDGSPKITRAESERRMQEGAKSFVDAARRDGHPELANWLAREVEEIRKRHASTIHGWDLGEYFDNKPSEWHTPAVRSPQQLYGVGFYAMLWASLGVAGLFISVLITRGGRTSRASRSTVATLSAFGAALWLGLTVLAVVQGLGMAEYGEFFGFQNEPQFVWTRNWQGAFWWAIALTFIITVVLREWGIRRSVAAERVKTNRFQLDVWRVVGWIAWSFAIVFLLCLCGEEQRRALLNLDALALWIAGFASLTLGALVLWHNKSTPEKPRSLFPFALNAVLVVGIAALAASFPEAEAMQLLGNALPIIGGIILAFWDWNKRKKFWSWPNIAANLETAGCVLSNIAIVVSLGYLLASLALLPTRRQMDNTVNRYIQVGEVEWLREQAK